MSLIHAFYPLLLLFLLLLHTLEIVFFICSINSRFNPFPFPLEQLPLEQFAFHYLMQN